MSLLPGSPPAPRPSLCPQSLEGRASVFPLGATLASLGRPLPPSLPQATPGAVRGKQSCNTGGRRGPEAAGRPVQSRFPLGCSDSTRRRRGRKGRRLVGGGRWTDDFQAAAASFSSDIECLLRYGRQRLGVLNKEAVYLLYAFLHS